MSEHNNKCSYWPLCIIHTGERLLESVGPAERKEIYDEKNYGYSSRALAKRHELTVWQITRVIRQQSAISYEQQRMSSARSSYPPLGADHGARR